MKEIYSDCLYEFSLVPNSKLFVFSNDDDDIVNFNFQKWETTVEDYQVGDSIIFGSTSLNKYDADFLTELLANMINFDGIRFKIFLKLFVISKW